MLLLAGGLSTFFSPGNGGYYLIILVFMALLLGLYLWGSSRKDKDDRATALQKRYKQLDRETLDAIPDDELLEAVIANLMSKLDARHPNPYKTIPLLSHGRCVVYSVWLLVKELDNDDFSALFAGPSAQFCELAANGLEELDAPDCAAAIREAQRVVREPQAEEDVEEELAQRHADFLEAVEREQPLALCVQLVRDDPAAFVDTDTADTDDASTLL